MAEYPCPRRPAVARWKLYLIPALACAVLGGWLVASSLGGSTDVAVTQPAPAATETSSSQASTTKPAATTGPADTAGPASDPTTTSTAPLPVRAADRKPGITPQRILIPSIGVDAPVGGLSLAGPAPEVPANFDDAGWYTQTRRPGDLGPAVIAGHIDSKTGPAVFLKLDQLTQGDRIQVLDEQGDERAFEVIGAGQYLKDQLPPEVFAFSRREPELRLITCGGVFDRESGHYQDNYVVYANAVDA